MPSKDPLRNVELLVPRVYAYVAYRIGDGPDAEDVTSETFERALRYRDTYDPWKGDPAAWLIGIARRCVDGAAAAAARAPAGEPPEVAAPGNLESDAVERLTLAAAVAALGPHDRELIALRYGADLAAADIARLLDVRTNVVEVGLHRARARLREQLESPGPPNDAPELEPGAAGI